MKNLSRYIKCSIVVSAILSLMACAGRLPIRESRTLDEYNKASLNDGMLVVSTAVNTGSLEQASSLYVMRTDSIDKKEAKKKGLKQVLYKIENDIYNKSNDLSLLYGTLPAGNYRIVQINFGLKYIIISTKSEWIGEFKIEAGKTSDLGMLVITAANSRLLVGRSRRFPKSNELLNRYYHKNAAFESTIDGWLDPVDQTDLAELFALEHTQGITGIAELPNGEIVAGSRLGTLMARSESGIWRILARNRFYDAVTYVTSVDETTANEFIAATDSGEILKVVDGAINKLSLGSLPNGELRFLDKDKNTNLWFAAVKIDDKLNLYQSDPVNTAQWKLVNSFHVGNTWMSGKHKAWVLKTKDGFAFGGGEKPTLNCFNYQTSQWITSQIPDKRVLIDFRANPITGVLSILTSPGGGFSGVFAKSYIAESCQSQWRQIKTPYAVEVKTPVPLNNGDLIAIGGVYSDEGLYSSSDSGESWSKFFNESVLSKNLYVTNNNGLFMIDTGQWGFETVEHSNDGGRTWKPELSNFDLNLLKAQNDAIEKQKGGESSR